MSELAKANQKNMEEMLLSDTDDWGKTDFDKKNETT